MKARPKSRGSSLAARSTPRAKRAAPKAPAEGLSIMDLLASHGHEQVSFFQDVHARYRGIIAIHSTALGPALGGGRVWAYTSAAAEPTGGGAPRGAPRGPSGARGGRNITAEDVGTSPADMAVIRAETRFVVGLEGG